MLNRNTLWMERTTQANKNKDKICWEYTRKECKHGIYCRFKHEDRQESQNPKNNKAQDLKEPKKEMESQMRQMEIKLEGMIGEMKEQMTKALEKTWKMMEENKS